LLRRAFWPGSAAQVSAGRLALKPSAMTGILEIFGDTAGGDTRSWL